MGHILSLNNLSAGVGEMAQWLRARTTLLEDAGLVPRIWCL